MTETWGGRVKVVGGKFDGKLMLPQKLKEEEDMVTAIGKREDPELRTPTKVDSDEGILQQALRISDLSEKVNAQQKTIEGLMEEHQHRARRLDQLQGALEEMDRRKPGNDRRGAWRLND